MAWLPIAQTVPQYSSAGVAASGYVLKAYAAGTTNVINMATDNTGSTTVTSMALNSEGYPNVSGTIVIPHVEETYKLALYPTQTAADADTGATWTIDNLTTAAISTTGTDELSKVSANDTTAGYLNGKLVSGTNIDFTENNNGANETLTLDVAIDNDLILQEQSDHTSTPTAGEGYLWVKNDTPSQAIFTDDAGTDFYVGSPLKTKVVDIGDWNMDLSSSVSVAHGLSFDKIRTCSVLIRGDATGFPVAFGAELGDSSQAPLEVSSTNVVLRRLTGGHFDSTNYNATSYNRGWITIQYV